jgi:hypothetical protein
MVSLKNKNFNTNNLQGFKDLGGFKIPEVCYELKPI